jgi:acyl-CoA thioester hydrolase
LEKPPVTEKMTVRYQDLDPYGHVNNAVHLALFESSRVAYMRELVVEAKLNYKAPIFLDDIVHGAARVSYISNRSLGMEYELRVGESYDTGRTVAEGSTALVFYDPDSEEVKPRPEWFLSAVADFEGRAESSFSREG